MVIQRKLNLLGHIHRIRDDRLIKVIMSGNWEDGWEFGERRTIMTRWYRGLVWHGTTSIGRAGSKFCVAADCVSCVRQQWAMTHGLMDGWMDTTVISCSCSVSCSETLTPTTTPITSSSPTPTSGMALNKELYTLIVIKYSSDFRRIVAYANMTVYLTIQNAQWCHVCQRITGFTHYLHQFLCLFQQRNCVSQILSVIMTYRTVPATTYCIFQSLQFPFVAFPAPLVEFTVFAFSLLTWSGHKFWVSTFTFGVSILIFIMMTRSVFKVPLSRHSHCTSSLSSFDERPSRTAPSTQYHQISDQTDLICKSTYWLISSMSTTAFYYYYFTHKLITRFTILQNGKTCINSASCYTDSVKPSWPRRG